MIDEPTQPPESLLAMPLDTEDSLFSGTPAQIEAIKEELMEMFLSGKMSSETTMPKPNPVTPGKR